MHIVRINILVIYACINYITSMLKAQNHKTKTNTNTDPNRYRRRCPDPNARIQKKEAESEEELQIKTQEDVGEQAAIDSHL